VSPAETATLASTTDATSQLLVATILVGTLIVLALERAHRVLVVICAVAAIWLISYLTPWHLIGFESAVHHLDLNVLLLLAGMMALVGVLKETGVFPWFVGELVHRTGNDPARAVIFLWWLTAIASALLDNVTTVIFVAPLAIAVARSVGAAPSLVVLPVIMAANIGGTATLIGDPPNVLIGSGAGLSFMDFVSTLTAPVIVMLVWLTWWSTRRLRRGMESDPAPATAVHTARPAVSDPGLLAWLGGISGVVFIGFITHGVTGMPAAIPALVGAAAALLVQDIRYLRTQKASTEERRHGILHILEREIEWPTLSFFAFLFIIIGAAVETGLIGTIAGTLERTIDVGRTSWGLSADGTLIFAALLILWVAGILSALMDNIPFVAVSIPIVGALIPTLPGDASVLWWALALGACLGGNGSPIGASANVTVLGLVEKTGVHITFREFVRTGAPVTLVTLLVSSVWCWLFVVLR
jgi:Na+/H+ antiporter NhaD/arsenite permease-like protein